MAVLQYGLLVAGILLLLLAGEDEVGRDTYAVAGALCLTAMALVSAVRAMAAGEIRMKSHTAVRATMPGQFWTTILLTRAIPAALLLFGAGWIVARGL